MGALIKRVELLNYLLEWLNNLLIKNPVRLYTKITNTVLILNKHVLK